MAKKIVMRIVAKARLAEMPIDPKQIIEGKPRARGMVAVEIDRGKYSAGIWECAPGTFDWDYEAEETCTILRGEAVVKVKGGETVRFGAGDLVHFSKGMRTRWTVKKKILKTFVLYG